VYLKKIVISRSTYGGKLKVNEFGRKHPEDSTLWLNETLNTGNFTRHGHEKA
jgi:hypothetical protein